MRFTERLRYFLLSFAREHNLIQTQEVKHPKLIFTFCYIIQSLQILCIVLPIQYDKDNVIFLIPELLISFTSVRAWNGYTSLEIQYFLGAFLFISALLLLTTLVTMISFPCSRKLNRLYEFIVSYGTDYYYYNLIAIPSIELGILLISKNLNATITLCTTSSCQTVYLALGIALLASVFIIVLYFEYIKVNYKYLDTDIAVRFSATRYILRLVLAAVLGCVSISTNSAFCSMICSLIWGGFLLFEIAFSCFIFPQYMQIYANNSSMLLQILSIYIIIERAMDYWRPTSLTFPFLSLLPIFIMLLLSLQRRNLARCWHNLSSKSDAKISLFQKDRSIRMLVYEFTNYKRYNYQFLEMIQPVLCYMDEINTAIRMQMVRGELEEGSELSKLPLFNPMTRIDPSNVYFSEISKKSLFQAIKHIYTNMLLAKRTKTPLWLLCSYISFANSVLNDNLQTMFAISNARKQLAGQLTFYNELIFMLLEKNVEAALNNTARDFSQKVESICCYSEQFEKCTKAVDKVVQSKANFYLKFLDAAVNLRTIKSDSRLLFRKAVQAAEQIESLLEICNTHIETHVLYKFYVKDILDDVNRYSQKVTINARTRIKQITEERDGSYHLEITNNILWNLDSHKNIFFIVVGMNATNHGQLIAFSKNVPKLLKSEESFLLGSKIGDFMAPFQSKVLEDLIVELQRDSKARQRITQSIDLFLRRANEGLMHFNVEMQIELYNGEPSIVLYMTRSDHRELEFFIFDNSRKVLGYSKKLIKSLRGSKIARTLGQSDFNPITAEEVIPDLAALPADGSLSLERKNGALLHNPFSDANERNDDLPKHMRVSYMVRCLTSSLARDYVIKVLILKSKKLKIVEQNTLPTIQSMNNIQDNLQNFSLEPKSAIRIHSSTVRKFKGLMGFYNRPELEEKIKEKQKQQQIEFTNSDNVSQYSASSQRVGKRLSNHKMSLFSGIARVIERMGSLDSISINESHRSQDKSDYDVTSHRVNNFGSEPVSQDRSRNPEAETSMQISKKKANSVNEVHSQKSVRDFGSKRLNSFRGFRSLMYSSEGTGKSKKVMLTIYQIKEIISRGEIPPLVFRAKLFGVFMFLVLCGMIIGAFFLLSEQYLKLSQKAYVIGYPGTVAEIVGSVAGTDELAIILQGNMINNSTRSNELSVLIANSTITAFNELVNWSSNFSSSYDVSSTILDLSRGQPLELIRSPSYETTPQAYTFEQSFEIFQGVLYILSQTNISQIVNTSSEVEFIRRYYWNYINLYDSMINQTYINFNSNVDEISLTYNSIVVVLTSTCIIGFVLFLPIFRRVQVHETQVLSKLCTISNEDLLEYLQKFKIVYMQYFKKPLTLGLIQNNREKKSKKSQGRGHKRFVYKSYNLLVHLAAFLVIGLSMFIFTYVYTSFMVSKTESSKDFMTDVNFLSMAKSTLVGIQATILYEINSNRSLSAYDSEYDQYGIINDNLIVTLQAMQQRILDNPIASDLLKQQYQSLSTNSFCQSAENDLEVSYCLSSFKAASKVGLAGLYSEIYNYVVSTRESLNSTNQSSIVDTEDFVGLVAGAKTISSVLSDTIQIEGGLLYSYCQTLKEEINWFLATGLLLVVVLLVTCGGQAYNSIKTQFMEVRFIFSQLPSELIANNTHIKNMLKQSGKSLI